MIFPFTFVFLLASGANTTSFTLLLLLCTTNPTINQTNHDHWDQVHHDLHKSQEETNADHLRGGTNMRERFIDWTILQRDFDQFAQFAVSMSFTDFEHDGLLGVLLQNLVDLDEVLLVGVLVDLAAEFAAGVDDEFLADGGVDVAVEPVVPADADGEAVDLVGPCHEAPRVAGDGHERPPDGGDGVEPRLEGALGEDELDVVVALVHLPHVAPVDGVAVHGGVVAHARRLVQQAVHVAGDHVVGHLAVAAEDVGDDLRAMNALVAQTVQPGGDGMAARAAESGKHNLQRLVGVVVFVAVGAVSSRDAAGGDQQRREEDRQELHRDIVVGRSARE
mmetsp:Transcript_14296/g.40671  ORF Transcript_14296/g.40671 Transcript_14296/m.40671 type:complete len:334 (+) Transcript_14296:105-1106(+)